MKKTMQIVMVLFLIASIIFVSGCSSGSSDYSYNNYDSRGAGGNGNAPVGGGCGVAMPANDASFATNALQSNAQAF